MKKHIFRRIKGKIVKISLGKKPNEYTKAEKLIKIDRMLGMRLIRVDKEIAMRRKRYSKIVDRKNMLKKINPTPIKEIKKIKKRFSEMEKTEFKAIGIRLGIVGKRLKLGRMMQEMDEFNPGFVTYYRNPYRRKWMSFARRLEEKGLVGKIKLKDWKSIFDLDD